MKYPSTSYSIFQGIVFALDLDQKSITPNASIIICHVICTRHKPQNHNVFVHNKQSRQLHFWCIINIPSEFNCTRNDLGSLIILFVTYNSGIIASMHLWCSYLETAASFRFQVCYGLFQMKQMVNITLSKYEYFSRFNVKLCFER